VQRHGNVGVACQLQWPWRMRIASVRIAALILLSIGGCTLFGGVVNRSRGLPLAVAELQEHHSGEQPLVGAVRPSLRIEEGDSGLTATGVPLPNTENGESHARLTFEGVKDGQVCFSEIARPSQMVASEDLDALLQKDLRRTRAMDAYRVEAFDTLAAIPKRPSYAEDKGIPLRIVGGAVVSSTTDLGSMQVVGDRVTDVVQEDLFEFTICGPVPPMTSSTRYLTVAKRVRMESGILHVWAVDDGGAAPATFSP
jgi:hypothetical protein